MQFSARILRYMGSLQGLQAYTNCVRSSLNVLTDVFVSLSLTNWVHPAWQGVRYVTPSDPQTGMKVPLGHSRQLPMQGGSRFILS